jgi:hypothetical protein
LPDKVLSRQPSRAEFAQKIIRAFREAGIEQVEQAEGDFSLKLGGGSTVFLSNVYANYCRLKRSLRETVVSEFVAAAASIPALPAIPSDFAEVKPSLMPVIRDAASFNMVQPLNRKEGWDDSGLEVVARQVAAGLVVGLAYDTDATSLRSIATLSRSGA